MDSSVFAFAGEKLISKGTMTKVREEIRNLMDRQNILVFDQDDGRQVSLDFTESGVSEPEPTSSGSRDPLVKKKPGRPKLGVVGREVTLLPRHWQWLDGQRGGASATLRRLVEQYRSENSELDRIRSAQDRTNRFIYAIAGNLSNFEEAVRALYGNNSEGFDECVNCWPQDIRNCTKHYAQDAWE